MIIFWVWIFHLVVIVKIQKMFSNITLFVGLGFCLFEKKHFKTSKLFVVLFLAVEKNQRILDCVILLILYMNDCRSFCRTLKGRRWTYCELQ